MKSYNILMDALYDVFVKDVILIRDNTDLDYITIHIKNFLHIAIPRKDITFKNKLEANKYIASIIPENDLNITIEGVELEDIDLENFNDDEINNIIVYYQMRDEVYKNGIKQFDED